jgi:HK97 family phage portal protein
MAFKVFQWIASKLATDSTKVTGFLDEEVVTDAGIQAWLRIMAYNTCVSKIAAAVGSCEFETYANNELSKKSEYWQWNYDPNPNQNKREFYNQLIYRLYYDEEALIVKSASGSMFVADTFTRNEFDITGDTFSDVMIKTTKLNQFPYRQQDVLDLKLESAGVQKVLSGIAEAEAKLIETMRASFIRDKGKHGVLKISDTAAMDKDFKDTYTDLINTRFSKYFSADSAVLPLFEGYEYIPEAPQAAGNETDKIRTMLNDTLELTAAMMGVPPSIVKGTGVTDDDFNAFMTYTVLPITKMIETEANRKLFGQAEVLAGNYMVVDTSPVKYSDLFGLATNIDKLISSGAFSVNDIRMRLNETTISEDWADQHWMTKNYSPADELMNGISEGGGTNGT